MNERFKALALQAKLKTELWNNSEPFVIYKEDVHNPGGLQKFAELIVRECLYQIADVRIENDFKSRDVDAALVSAISGIRKQFGL